MTRFDRPAKVAISLPDDVLERIDGAAERAGMNRSEFFRRAGLRFAIEVDAALLTHGVDAYVEATGDDGTSDAEWLTRGKALLAAGGEDW